MSAATLTRRVATTVVTLECTQCPRGTYRATSIVGTYACTACDHSVNVAHDVVPYLEAGESLTLDAFGNLAAEIPAN